MLVWICSFRDLSRNFGLLFGETDVDVDVIYTIRFACLFLVHNNSLSLSPSLSLSLFVNDIVNQQSKIRIN